MSYDSLIAALNAAMPDMPDTPNVRALRDALADVNKEREPLRVRASRLGIRASQLRLARKWIRANNGTLTRQFYGSGDSGHSEAVDWEASTGVAPDSAAIAAFESAADILIEDLAGIEDGDGGSVTIVMDANGLRRETSYVEAVDQPTTWFTLGRTAPRKSVG